ncbi:MAG: sigma-70 family RNA polymerase sigma factor [Chthoniobacter sp.]|nr:sigma-70 family RNA polymerase sigma factor [Chthoniobacter sp.]
MKTTLLLDTVDDAGLVALCLSGNRQAFGSIIARYQSLICALAYSACGDRGRSEDLAQDTFVSAWKHLHELNEPAKLKGWLCGIARNLTNNTLRREQRTPTAHSDPLSPEEHCHAGDPHEQAASKEEEALVWQALEAMPPEYREPMVLFYREGRSAQAVATALDLSEDAVWQRLSRGRSMLKENVAKTVEFTLAKGVPGKAFTLAVLAALPMAGTSAKAATAGSALAKGGGAAAKSTAAFGLFGFLFGQVLIFSGNYVGYRTSLAAANSDAERAAIKAFFRRNILWTIAFFIPFAGWVFGEGQKKGSYSSLFGLLPGLLVIYILVTAVSLVVLHGKRRKYFIGLAGRHGGGDFPKPAWEYRSRWSFFGLPLVHIRIGDRFAVLRGPVKAWIAAGGYAIGGLFAYGGLAIAPVSIGFCALGLLPFGAMALGLVSFGGVSLGVWSFGGLAIGWQAMGGCAIAWNAACGNVSLAHVFAVGNDAVSRRFLQSNLFFRSAILFDRYWLWWNLLWIIPMTIQGQILARCRRSAYRTS